MCNFKLKWYTLHCTPYMHIRLLMLYTADVNEAVHPAAPSSHSKGQVLYPLSFSPMLHFRTNLL